MSSFPTTSYTPLPTMDGPNRQRQSPSTDGLQLAPVRNFSNPATLIATHSTDTLDEVAGPNFQDDEPLIAQTKPLSTLHLYGLGAVGFTIEFCWAAGEALIIPHMLRLGLSVQVAGLVWLVNPVISVFAQPMMGAWSDRCQSRWGRRRPFMGVLTIMGSLGMALLVFGQQIFPDNPTLLIGLGFLGNALADLTHNSLLPFGRALIGDIVPAEQSEIAHNAFTMQMMVGRLVALLAGLVPLNNLFPVFTEEPQSQSLFFLALISLIACTAITCLCAHEEQFTPNENENGNEKQLVGEDLLNVEQAKKGNENWVDKFRRMYKDGGVLDLPAAMWWLLVILSIGWVALEAQIFYWTQWVGLDTKIPGTDLYAAFLGMITYAVASIVVTLALPYLNVTFNPRTVLISGEISIMVCLSLTKWITGIYGSAILSAGIGFGYAIHSNNSYLMCDAIISATGHEHTRGLYHTLISGTLTLGQGLIGAFAGLIIAAMNNSINSFFGIVGLCGLLGILALWALPSPKPTPRQSVNHYD